MKKLLKKVKNYLKTNNGGMLLNAIIALAETTFIGIAALISIDDIFELDKLSDGTIEFLAGTGVFAVAFYFLIVKLRNFINKKVVESYNYSISLSLKKIASEKDVLNKMLDEATEKEGELEVKEAQLDSREALVTKREKSLEAQKAQIKAEKVAAKIAAATPQEVKDEEDKDIQKN